MDINSTANAAWLEYKMVVRSAMTSSLETDINGSCIEMNKKKMRLNLCIDEGTINKQINFSVQFLCVIWERLKFTAFYV